MNNSLDDKLVQVRMPARFAAWAETWLAASDLPVTEENVEALFQQMIDELFDPSCPRPGDDPPCCDPGGGMRGPE